MVTTGRLLVLWWVKRTGDLCTCRDGCRCCVWLKGAEVSEPCTPVSSLLSSHRRVALGVTGPE